MKFLKHIGKVGDRKVAIIFRQIPGEDHMCLIVYTEIINAQLHDDLMRVIESDEAQSTDALSDILNRKFTTNGQVLLQFLHQQGFLKKMQTEQVWVTPTPTAKVKLSELNDMLNKMAQGEEAIKQLEEMENSKGLQMPADVRRRREEAMAELERTRAANKAAKTAPLQAPSGDALGDDAIAASLDSQASRMLAEAKGLMAEAERMQREAAEMRGSVVAETKVEAKPKKERVKKTKQAV